MQVKMINITKIYLLAIVFLALSLTSCVRPAQVALPKRVPEAVNVTGEAFTNIDKGSAPKTLEANEETNKRTLTVTVTEGTYHMNFANWKDAFEEMHPDVEVIFNTWRVYLVNPENDIARIVAELASGAGDDLISPTFLPFWKMNESALFENLYGYLDKDNEITRNDFYPNMLKAMEVDGALYALPSDVSFDFYKMSRSFKPYIPKDLDSKISLTIFEMIEVFEKVKSVYTGQENITMLDDATMFHLFRSEITRFVKPADHYVDFGTEFLAYANLIEKYRIPYRTYAELEAHAWKEYDTAVFSNLTGNFVQYFPISNDEIVAPYYGTWLMEGSNGTIGFIGEADLSINANSKNKDLAWEFIKFTTGNEAYKHKRLMNIPARKSVFDNAFTESLDMYMANLEYVDVTREEARKNLLHFLRNVLGMVNYYSDARLPFMQESIKIMENYERGFITLEEMAREMQDKLEIYINE